MANQKIERQLESLNALRSAGASAATFTDLSKALNDRVNVVVAKAANIAATLEAKPLTPDLMQAYDRFFKRASESDPQCLAKTAIARCLKDFGFAESNLFLQGLKHHQWESTWGGKTDTAATLRSTCALALVHCTDLPRHETLVELVDLLSEAEATVRADAARALEQMGGREVSLILRLKARCGDKEASVTGQILESLLGLEGPAAISFVADFLHNPDPVVREECALSLGASRLPEAIEVLKKAWTQQALLLDPSTLLRAISASRQDSAIDFLLDQIATGRVETAQDCLWALQLHRNSEELVARIDAAVSDRPELRSTFDEIYRRQH